MLHLDIIKLIVLATLLSTLTSLGGGLMMYFSSVSLLRQTVEDVSKGEVNALKIEISKCFEDCVSTASSLYPLYYSQSVMKGDRYDKTDVSAWAEANRWISWSRLAQSSTLYEIGIALHAYNFSHDETMMYNHVWYDPLKSGSREYVYARYHNGLFDDGDQWTNRDGIRAPVILGHSMNEDTGELISNVYNTTMVYTYIRENTAGWPPANATYLAPGFQVGPAPAAFTRWRPPAPYYASDGNSFVYMAYDMFFTPPPPPHPWSNYKLIMLQASFVFNTWNTTISEYAASHEATVVILDKHNFYIYAATTGDRLVSQGCWDDKVGRGYWVRDDIRDCITYLNDMPQDVQSSWSSVEAESEDTFTVTSSHFVRSKVLKHWAPPGEEPVISAHILWLRSVSSLQEDINNVLILLVVFAATVFLLDLCIALVEVFLVGKPLNQITAVLPALEVLDLDRVSAMLNIVLHDHVRIIQVVQLVKGFQLAVTNLRDYKAFLPNTLFVTDQHDERLETSFVSEVCESENDVTRSQSSRVSVSGPPMSTPSAVRVRLGTQHYNRASLMMVSMRRTGLSDSEFQAFVQRLEVVVSLTKGLLHGISPIEPESFYISWNAGVGCSGEGGLYSCCRAGCLLSEGEVINVSISHGMVRAGNVGTLTFRGFSCMGDPVQHLKMQHQVSRQFGSKDQSTAIVIRSNVALAMAGLYDYFPLGVVTKHIPAVIHQLIGETKAKNEEWIYQSAEVEISTFRCLVDRLLVQKITGTELERIVKSFEKLITQETPPQAIYLHEMLMPHCTDPEAALAAITFAE